MADEDWYEPRRPAAPARHPQPGELLFEFVRGSDRTPMSCELRFHGQSYGWEAQFLERSEIFASHGGFPLRELAVTWAQEERQIIEHGPCAHCGCLGWMCEAHPQQPADHEPTCAGPAMACPHCRCQTSDERPLDAERLRSLGDE
jgi:hypothetical protein